MSALTDHERPLPASVIARGADTNAHCAVASGTNRSWFAVLSSPPTGAVYGRVETCDSIEDGIGLLAELPEFFLPAYVARRTSDGQWVPAGPERAAPDLRRLAMELNGGAA